MVGFGKKKKTEKIIWDPSEKYPVIRCGICTGEQVAGFRKRGNGSFEEIMLLKNDSDFQLFCEMVGTTDIPKEF